MDYTIRRAQGSDYEALCRVLAEADNMHLAALPFLFQPTEQPVRSGEYLEQLLAANPQALYLVVEAGGQIIGALLADPPQSPSLPMFTPRRTVMIEVLAVAAAWRRQGVGRALMAAVEAWAAEQRVDDLELNVYEFNTGAIAFYQALGYQGLSRRLIRRVSNDE